MHKYALIKFESAKFVINDLPKLGDFVIIYDEKTGKVNHKARDFGQITSGGDVTKLITSHQISGLLHVLLGCRPSSFYKKTYKSSSIIDGLAKQALFKLGTCCNYTTKSGDVKIFKEFTNGSKSVWNANKACKTPSENNKLYNCGYLTWDVFKRKFLIASKQDAYNVVIDFIEEKFGKIEDLKREISFLDLLLKIKDDESLKESFLERIERINGLTPIISLINGVDVCGHYNNNISNNLSAQLVLNGVKNKATIDGYICIPVDDKLSQKFCDGVRFGTFGDGGLASFQGIISLFDSEDLINEGFQLIEF